MADHPAGTGAPPLPRRWLVLVLLGLAQFMVIMDMTVVNVALPNIGDSLRLDRESLTWVITAYTLTFGGLLILGGRLADIVGRKTAFLAGLALFIAASMVSGLAIGGVMLVGGRVAQGVGAALLSPAALSILTTEFTGRDRTRALGVWGAIGGGGAAIGVLVGGALTSGPGWKWAFLVNVPVGFLVGHAAHHAVPTRPRRGASRIDVLGAITGTAAVGLLIYGLIRAGDKGWTSAWTLGPIGAAILVALAFTSIERRAVAPLLPLALLRRAPLPGGVGVMMGASALMLSTYFLSSIYLQHVRAFSPLRTGLAFVPVGLAAIVGAHLAAKFVVRVGVRPTGIGSMALAALGLGLLAWRGTTGGVLTALLPGFLLTAIGIGAAFVTATITAMTGMDHRHAGVASGILNTGHELGGSIGIAVVSAIAASSISGSTSDPASGFAQAFAAAAVIAAFLAAAAPALLPKGRPPQTDTPIFVH